MDFATLNKQRKFILIAAVVGVISIFLPWLSILGLSVSGFHSYGTVAFLGFVCAGIITITGDQTKPLDNAMWLVGIIAGAISLLFTLLYMTNLSGIEGFGSGFGIGIWLSVLASIGVLASAWLLKSPGNSLQDGFDSLKTKVTAAANTNTSDAGSQAGTDKVDQLERLIKLKEDGKITEEEYLELRSKLL